MSIDRTVNVHVYRWRFDEFFYRCTVLGCVMCCSGGIWPGGKNIRVSGCFGAQWSVAPARGQQFKERVSWLWGVQSDFLSHFLHSRGVILDYTRWRRVRTQRLLRVLKTVFLCLLVSSPRLQTVWLYWKIKRQTPGNTSMIARASWISTMCTNISFHRRLLRSYKASVCCWSRTPRPRPRLLMLPAQSGDAGGVRGDRSAASVEVFELG